MANEIKNVVDLRNDLLDVYNKTKSGEIDRKQASTIVSAAATVLKSVRIELSYDVHMDYSKKISFLEKPE